MSRIVLFLTVALAIASCSGNDDGSAAVTSIPDETTTSVTTTSEPDTVAPDIIPNDVSLIDEAYVEGVLNALAVTNADVLSLTREAGLVTEDVIAMVDATSSEADAIESINSLARLAREGFDRYSPELTPATYEVLDLLTATDECIVVEVTVDRSGLFVKPPSDPPPGRTLLELLPATEQQRASGLNPTAWVVDSAPVVREGDPLPDCQVAQ